MKVRNFNNISKYILSTYFSNKNKTVFNHEHDIVYYAK